MKNKDRIKHEEEYVAFLERRVASANYMNSVSKEEYEQTKAKLKKARMVLKLLKG